jgi:serine/threonine-protein kinase
MIALAIYQWVELLEVRAGRTPSCAINETVNCATVWNSPLSHKIHEYLGIPVAGMGVLWAVVAFTLAFLFAQRVRANADGSTFSGAIKVWAGIGLLSCVMFATASLQAKAVCLTCLGTYALVIGYTIAALGMIGGPAVPPMSELMPGAGWTLVLTVPVYLGLLYPGFKTPKGTDSVVKKLNEHDPNDFAAIIDTLPDREKLTTSWARDQWKKSAKPDTSMFPERARKGNPAAPVKIVEWSDILCGHCAQFEELAKELERLAPEGGFAFEPRYYPLDGECNPDIKGSAKDGVRCFGAKLQICAEKSPKFYKLRSELFQNQQQLDLGMMMAIATRHGFNSDDLNACVRSPETQARLMEDIAYARLFGIDGTPLVVLNGKAAPPAPAFLLGMVLAGGNADAPWFLKLPPPPAE